MKNQQKFYALNFEQQADGTIRLEQESNGGPSTIDLHPVQLAHVAQAFSNQPSPMPSIPTDFARRVERLRNDAERLYEFLASVPSFPPSAEEDEDVQMAGTLLDDFDALLDDYFDLAPDDKPHHTHNA